MTHFITTEYSALVKRVINLGNEIKAECSPRQLGYIILDCICAVGGLWKGATKLAKTVYILDKYAGLVENGFSVISVFGPVNVNFRRWINRLIDLDLIKVSHNRLPYSRTYELTSKGLRLVQQANMVIENDNLKYLVPGILFPLQTNTLIDLAYTATLHPGTDDKSQSFSKDRFNENQPVILRTLLYNILRYMRRDPLRKNPVMKTLEISETLVVKNLTDKLSKPPPLKNCSDLKDYNSDLATYLQACNIYNLAPRRNEKIGRACSFDDILAACTRIGYFQVKLLTSDISNDEKIRLKMKISQIRRCIEHDIRYLSRNRILKTKKSRNTTFYFNTARKYLDSETNESIELPTKSQINKLREEMIAELKKPDLWNPNKSFESNDLCQLVQL